MMTEKVNGRNLFSHWLLPEAGLNGSITVNDTVTIRYIDRLLGNLPRLMALDKFGNNSLMYCVNQHISATKQLEHGPDVATDQKYEFYNIVRVPRAVRRCYPVEPNHHRLAQTGLGEAPQQD